MEILNLRKEIDKLKKRRIRKKDVRVIVELKKDSLLDAANKQDKKFSDLSESEKSSRKRD